MLQSIRSRISTTFLSILFLVTALLGSSSYYVMKDTVYDIQKRNFEFVADQVARNISHFMEMKEDSFRRISEGKEFVEYYKNYRDAALVEYFNKFRGEFPVLSYVNGDGHEQVKAVHGQMDDALEDLSKSSFYQDALWSPNKVIHSQVVQSLETGEPAVTLAIAKHNYFGDTFAGVLMGQLSVTLLSEELKRIKIGERGFATLIDNDGNIIVHPDNYKKSSKISDSEEFIANLGVLDKGVHRVSVFGIDCLVVYSSIHGMEWSVITALPYDEIMEAPNTLLRSGAAIFLLVFLVGSFLSLRLSRKLALPIMKVERAAARIAEGDLDHTVDIHEEGEIGSLIHSFNAMVGDLNRSQKELISAKNYTENIIRSMINSLFVLDNEMNIIHVNRATCSMLGYREEELIGSPISRILPGNVTTSDKGAPSGNADSINEERTFVTKEGKAIPVLFSSAVIRDGEQNVQGIVCASQDISDIRNAQELLKKSHNELEKRVQERTMELSDTNRQLELEISERNRAELELVKSNEILERRNMDLQNFLHIASHDLQEPLRKVMTFGDRLKDQCGSRLDDRGRDYIERMQKASKRMQSLIESLLSYSRITTKARPFEPVNLFETMEEVITDLEIPIEQSGGRIEFHDLPTIQADPLQIRQMFQNIISNALKYRKKDTPPLIRIRGEHISADNGNDADSNDNKESYNVTVEDNGIGFDQKYAERIFGIFQRLHGKDEYEGTGIGLSICQKIVERHGGTISATSTPGVGSAFTVSLPVEPAGDDMPDE